MVVTCAPAPRIGLGVEVPGSSAVRRRVRVPAVDRVRGAARRDPRRGRRAARQRLRVAGLHVHRAVPRRPTSGVRATAIAVRGSGETNAAAVGMFRHSHPPSGWRDPRPIGQLCVREQARCGRQPKRGPGTAHSEASSAGANNPPASSDLIVSSSNKPGCQVRDLKDLAGSSICPPLRSDARWRVRCEMRRVTTATSERTAPVLGPPLTGA